MDGLTIGVIIAIFTTIIGVYVWVAKHQIWVSKHLSDSNKHPSKSDIVFKDVCKKTQDCLEEQVSNLNEKLSDFKEDTKERLGNMDVKLDNIICKLK